MQLLEYILLRLYANRTSSEEAMFILIKRMGYTKEDMNQIDREIISKEWKHSDTSKESIEFRHKRMMEYEMQ